MPHVWLIGHILCETKTTYLEVKIRKICLLTICADPDFREDSAKFVIYHKKNSRGTEVDIFEKHKIEKQEARILPAICIYFNHVKSSVKLAINTRH